MLAHSKRFPAVSAAHRGWVLEEAGSHTSHLCLPQAEPGFSKSGMWVKELLFEEEAGTGVLDRLFQLCTPRQPQREGGNTRMAPRVPTACCLIDVFCFEPCKTAAMKISLSSLCSLGN